MWAEALGYRFSIGKNVGVIGGGNVAMDVARSAAREVLKQHRPEDAVPSEENIATVATRFNPTFEDNSDRLSIATPSSWPSDKLRGWISHRLKTASRSQREA